MSIDYCNCNICEKYFKLNKKRYIEDRYCITELVNFFDSYDFCDGYYENNIKYKCEVDNFYCLGCGFCVDFKNATSKEMINEMVKMLGEHDFNNGDDNKCNNNCEIGPDFEDFVEGNFIKYNCCNYCKEKNK
jgi:hypothetical protein